MRKAAWLVVVIVLLSGTSVFAAGSIKIGVVDLVRALNESESGKKSKAELELLIKSKQTVIEEKGTAIEKAKSDLEKQASALSPDARRSREEDLERLIREYQRLVSDSQSEVKKKETELAADILKDIRAIIQKTGQEEAYTLILENVDGQILYSIKETDLTDIVLKKYNETIAKTKK
jgi:outer membrane protein